MELTTSLLHLHFTFTYNIRHCYIVLMLSIFLNVFLFLTRSGTPTRFKELLWLLVLLCEQLIKIATPPLFANRFR